MLSINVKAHPSSHTTWLFIVASLAMGEAALLVVVMQTARHRLNRQRASTIRILESLPDYYAPQRSAALKIKPLGISIVPQPSSSPSP